MRREMSLRRRVADPAGSNGHGSAGMVTRARQRRLLAESSERLGSCHTQQRGNLGPSGESAQNKRRTTEALVHHGPQEWRDWANLFPDLVAEISGRLLSFDVAEYLRFRAVCRPWRDLTADPRARLLDSRFRPRNWIVLSITQDARPHRRLLNLATAASLGVDLPSLSTHCHLCAADGLLVLFHQATKSIRLLDPLSNAVTKFPAISSIVAAVPPSWPEYLSAVFRDPSGVDSRSINGAGFDDSTSPPTLMLCLREGMTNIVFAKPGDAHWTLVSAGQASHPIYDRLGRVLFYSFLALGGRCYVSSPHGSVYLVELRPLPRLVAVVDQRCFATEDIICNQRMISFLVSCSGGKMLMVRYWRGIRNFGTMGACNRKELFTVRGTTKRIELLEVDIAGGRLVPMRSLGRFAVFVGLTHCLCISTETFPSVAADAIYLGCRHQQSQQFSIYHINSKRSNRRTEPPHKFFRGEDRELVPSARPCNLDQYLVCYVDRRHGFSGACINHAKHYFYQRVL